MAWTSIEGWFSEGDAGMYRHWAQMCPDDVTIVEIGTWKGRSACCLLEELTKVGKTKVRVIGIDLFGSTRLSDAAANLKCFGDRIQLICADGHKVAEAFQDGSVWGVFIDADHEYPITLSMIKAWLPKIQRGGWIGGHDYSPDWSGVMKAVQEVFPIHPVCFSCCWGLPWGWATACMGMDQAEIKNPSVSIVMPCFNTPHQYLRECLRSIQAQTLTDWELIIGDGGSTDRNTLQVLLEFVTLDPRITLRYKPGYAITPSLNDAISRTRCDVVANMDSDDVMTPDRLKMQVRYLRQHPEVDLVGAQIDYIGKPGKTSHPSVITDAVAATSSWFMNHPTIMYRKEAVLAVGGYPPEVDYGLMLRLAKAGFVLHNLPQVMAHYRIHPAQTTKDADVVLYAKKVREQVDAEFVKHKFTRIYKQKWWAAKGCLSGDGSTDEAVAGLSVPLKDVLKLHKVGSILDVGCGINPWMERVLAGTDVQYTGIDVVQLVIDTRKKLLELPGAEYLLRDMTGDPWDRKFDLAISRDVITHLSAEHGLRLLQNVKASCRYLLTTHWSGAKFRDIVTGDWRQLDLTKAPYNLPEPTLLIPEVDSGKYLALFDLATWADVQ